MANDQSVGVSERVLYGAVIFATAKLVQNNYITADMQAYIAAGIVTFGGGAVAWWQNRPARIIDRAAAQLPDKTKLVIETAPDAPSKVKDIVHELVQATSEKVTTNGKV